MIRPAPLVHFGSLHFGVETTDPIGHFILLGKDARFAQRSPVDTVLTTRALEMLRNEFAAFNRQFVKVKDAPGKDVWTPGLRGDCEDFATGLYLRYASKGVSKSSMSFILGMYGKEQHLVLGLATTNGWLTADTMSAKMRTINELRRVMSFEKATDRKDPGNWRVVY